MHSVTAHRGKVEGRHVRTLLNRGYPMYAMFFCNSAQKKRKQKSKRVQFFTSETKSSGNTHRNIWRSGERTGARTPVLQAANDRCLTRTQRSSPTETRRERCLLCLLWCTHTATPTPVDHAGCRRPHQIS